VWSNGDVLKITLPMKLHLHYMNDDPTVAAVMYGPLVLAGLTGYKRSLALLDPSRIDDVIQPVAGKPNTFVATVDGGKAVMQMIPIHTVITETYGVYWKLVSAATSSVDSSSLVVQQQQTKIVISA